MSKRICQQLIRQNLKGFLKVFYEWGRFRFEEIVQKMEIHMVSVVSMGGGVNSTAILIGLRDRGEKPDAILFADTGGEKPPTYTHVDLMKRWCIDNKFPEIQVITRDCVLHESLEDECHNNGTLPSKAFGFGGCSDKWKRTPMDKWVKKWEVAQNEWAAGRLVNRLIGIHAGEPKRGKIPDDVRFHYVFPLKEWGWGQDECAAACEKELGYSPVKSACFYCPSMRKTEVVALSVEFPDLFRRAVEMEQSAKEAGGLNVIKGLGRHWSWEDLVKRDKEQLRMFEDSQPPICDTCIDW